MEVLACCNKYSVARVKQHAFAPPVYLERNVLMSAKCEYDVQFAMAQGRESIVLKVFRQSGPLRTRHPFRVHTTLSKVVDEIPRPSIVRQPPRHKAVPGCTADCHVGKGVIERQGLRCQLVKVGRHLVVVVVVVVVCV
jgi:hypothetical protein